MRISKVFRLSDKTSSIPEIREAEFGDADLFGDSGHQKGLSMPSSSQ